MFCSSNCSLAAWYVLVMINDGNNEFIKLNVHAILDIWRGAKPKTSWLMCSFGGIHVAASSPVYVYTVASVYLLKIIPRSIAGPTKIIQLILVDFSLTFSIINFFSSLVCVCVFGCVLHSLFSQRCRCCSPGTFLVRPCFFVCCFRCCCIDVGFLIKIICTCLVIEKRTPSPLPPPSPPPPKVSKTHTPRESKKGEQKISEAV